MSSFVFIIQSIKAYNPYMVLNMDWFVKEIIAPRGDPTPFRNCNCNNGFRREECRHEGRVPGFGMRSK